MAKIVPPMNFGLVEDGLYRSAQPSELNFSFLEKLNLRSVIWVGAEEPSEIFQSFLDSQGIIIHNLAPTIPLNPHFPPTFSDPGSSTLRAAFSAPSGHTSTFHHGLSSSSMNPISKSTNTVGGGGGTSIGGIGGPPIFAKPPSHLHAQQTNMGLIPYSSTSLHLPPLPPPPEPLIIHALTLLLQPQTFPTLVCCNMGRHRTGTVVGCYRKLQRWALSSILEEYRRYAGMKVRVLNEQFIELFDTDLVSVSNTVEQTS